jgi:hypothetical protein
MLIYVNIILIHLMNLYPISNLILIYDFDNQYIIDILEIKKMSLIR